MSDEHGLYIVDEPAVITSVEPLEGAEGTVVTLRGSGFSRYIRNNCVVVANLGACARAQEGSTPNQLRVRIDPVAKVTQGDVMMWPGAGSNFFNEHVGPLRFSETAIFRNGAPIACADVNFKLTKASPNTYGGTLEKTAPAHISLGGHEKGYVLCARIPSDISFPKMSTVDICCVLKEHPTVAIDFTAVNEGDNLEDCLHALAQAIVINGGHIGERVFADVVKNGETFEICVTKPYLEKGLLTIHFSRPK